MQMTNKLNLKKIENHIRKKTKISQLHELIRKARKKKIIFIEGPPTMNGKPHIGHLRGRIIKDFWYRNNTLKGHYIKFNSGWDTQGLPIELQAEKELNIHGSKTTILKYSSIEKLVLECKKLVNKYQKFWICMDELLGMSFNQKLAYKTCDDHYIEKEWQILKTAYENKILTEGYMVVGYCPSCQTSLSHAEINQTYEVVEDPSLYYKVRLSDENAFLIVWTTMPFTLITDAMIGVNPEEYYVYIKTNNEVWIICEKRINEFTKEMKISSYHVIKKIKGIELEGKKYIHPLLRNIPKLQLLANDDNFHITVAEKFVDANTGSGLVHIAPANGEDDYEVAVKRKISIFNPIDDEAKFNEDAGTYANLFVRNADKKIINDLIKNEAMVKIGKINHKYPLCWRSKHRIIWLARRGFFYMLDRLGNNAINAASSANYFFAKSRNRFLNIVQEKHPWCISRERFWGCPIPIWNCKKCGRTEKLFSRNEIINKAYKLPDGPNFELHRPWIDKISIKCEKCNSIMEREQFVLDTWHNSGAAMYASLSNEEYDNETPVCFLTEGIDQTRGWAYTLLIENVILQNKSISPYKTFLFQGHVLDNNGNKMSKSLGNVIDAIDIMNKYPVDIIRFYFIWKSNPIDPINFNEDEIMLRPYQIINTLYNVHVYFKQNSEYDKFIPTNNNKKLQIADQWILSKFQKLIIQIDENNENCRFHETAKRLEDFIINSLSQIYIPMIREELWNESGFNKDRRDLIYNILFIILKNIYLLIHPISPFISEFLYLDITGKQNILTSKWPKPKIELINDNVEKSFELMKDITSMVSSARVKGNIKRRWPLNNAKIYLKKDLMLQLLQVKKLLIKQINVKHCEIIEVQNKNDNTIKNILELYNQNAPMKPIIKVNMKTVAPKLKENTNRLIDFINDKNPIELLKLIQKKEILYIDDEYDIEIDENDLKVDFIAENGYIKSSKDDKLVFLSIERDKEMLIEGFTRDLARRLQSLRKERGYKPTDILNIASIVGLKKDKINLISKKRSELAQLVRVKNVNFMETCNEYKNYNIDGEIVMLSVE
ncbi:MAG: isoleucine--tRNA ligase [Thaumarchaeota archaeon]|nr:isoleucine--tRNA ligase [Nitrososphaerota archaeon]